jgi:hypothetical protein
MTHEDAQQIIKQAEEAMSVDDARQFVNAEKAVLTDGAYTKSDTESPDHGVGDGLSIEMDTKMTRQQLVQRIFSNYKDSLSPEDSKTLSKIAEDSMTERILENTRGGLAEDDARQIIYNAENSMTDDEAREIIKNAAGTMSVEDAQNLVQNAQRVVHDLETGTEEEKDTTAQGEAGEIIEGFKKTLSEDDSQQIQAHVEYMLIQQILDNAKGTVSESEARAVVRNGLKGMTQEDAQQIIKQAEETMSVEDARQFVNAEKAVIGDVANDAKAHDEAEKDDAGQVLEDFKKTMSKEDSQQI